MDYVNGGVREILPNARHTAVMTKRRLKELCRTDPGLVEFYPTSPFGSQYEGRLNRVPAHMVLVITGPDPYSVRKWHANVRRYPTRDEVKVT